MSLQAGKTHTIQVGIALFYFIDISELAWPYKVGKNPEFIVY